MSRRLFHPLGRWFALIFLSLYGVLASAASISISPISVQMPVKATRTFQATLTGLTNNQVKWYVNDMAGGNSSVGTISAGGAYVSPDSPGLEVTVTAESVANPSLRASALVSLRHRVPWVLGTSPTWLPLGNYTLSIMGERFVPGAQVFLAGKAMATTFVSDKLLRISGQVGPGQIGTQTLVVSNPGPVPSATYTKLAVVNTAPVLALQPAPPADPAKVAAGRFLAQASFGPTAADLAFVQANGMKSWLDRQFDPIQTPPSTLPDGVHINEIRKRQFLNMAHGQDTLRQRMMFALSQILVISAEKNVNADEIVPWQRLLAKHAFGNYRDLLAELTLDASMGKYLDLANSRKPAASNQSGANENYARELLQLFSIGLVQLNQDGSTVLDAAQQPIATYNQNDIRQFALALTGWTFPTPPGRLTGNSNGGYYPGRMEALPMFHDDSAKTLLGGTSLPQNNGIENDLEDVLDNLFNHPNLPPFLATRLIRSLVTSNPGPDYIRRVADVFAGLAPAPGYPLAPRGDLKATLAAILLDPDASLADVDQGHLKDPVLHLIGLARALDAQFTDPGMFMYIMTYLGERVLNSPTVFSFYSPLTPLPGQPDLFGPEFQIYSPSQAVQRANLIYTLLQDQNGNALSLNLTPFQNDAINPNALLDRINDTLFQGAMSAELRGTLYKVAAAHSDLKQRALVTLYLAAISSEYTVAH